MTFEEARRVLGLHPLNELTENDVRKGFASAARLAHPDVSGGWTDERANMARITEAKDTLMRLVSVADLNDGTCIPCKGVGSVRGTFLNVVCKSCGGSGRDKNLSRR